MKNKKITLLTLVLLFGILFSIPSFASEETISLDFSPKNYYKIREEVYAEGNSIPEEVPMKFSFKNSLPIKDYIIQEVKKLNTEIDISSYGILKEDMSALILSIFEVPELYYMSTSARYSYVTDPDTNIKYGEKILFTYTMDSSQIAAADAIIDGVLQDYLSGIKPEWNDLEKALYTNNYLCINCSYAANIIESSHTLYGALVDKVPVCDGYSKAFKFLLSKVGVDSLMVTSTYMNHAWNLVKIDQDYYHVDVTWNDDDAGVGTVTYQYFVASDSGFSSIARKHSNWIAENNQTATNTKFDNVSTWLITKHYLIYKDNYWYYLHNNTGAAQIVFAKIDLRNYATTASVKTIPISSTIFIGPAMTTDGEYLYFNSNYSINRMNFDGTNITSLYSLATSASKVIYSVYYDDGDFYYDTLDVVNGSASTSTRKTNLLSLITGIKLDKTTLKLEQGEETELVATVLPANTSEDKTVTWESSDNGVVTVDNSTGKTTIKAVGEGSATIIAYTVNGLTAECLVTVTPKLTYTTLPVQDLEGSLIIVLPIKTVISEELTSENFPVIDNGYSVDVYASDDSIKTTSEFCGSENKIKIKDAEGNVKKEYIIVVNGDINGDGKLMMYDSFQILKGAILPGTQLDSIDKLIRDVNGDGNVMLYDAFQFIKKSIIG